MGLLFSQNWKEKVNEFDTHLIPCCDPKYQITLGVTIALQLEVNKIYMDRRLYKLGKRCLKLKQIGSCLCMKGTSKGNANN